MKMIVFLIVVLTIFTMPSIFAATINSTSAQGAIIYAESSITTPRYQFWNVTQNNFTGERTDTQNVGNTMTWVVAKANHERDEILLVTEDTGSTIDAQVLNATLNWTGIQTISTGVSSSAQRGFDVAYMDISGNALITYENSALAGNNVIGFRIWNGSNFSAERNYTTTMPNSAIRWVKLVPKSGTNQVMALLHDGAGDLSAVLWNGTDFNASTAINLSAATGSSTEQHFDFVWEANSGDGIAAYTSGTAWARRNFTGAAGTWSAAETEDVGNAVNGLRLCSDPFSDYIGVIFQDAGTDVNVRIWNGSRVITGFPTEDATTEAEGANNVNVDCAWNTNNGGVALFGFIDVNSLNISFVTFNRENESWSTTSLLTPQYTTNFATDDIQGLRFIPSPTTNETMIVALDILEDLSVARWSGSVMNSTINASPLERATQVLNGNNEDVFFDWYRFDPEPTVLNLTLNATVLQNNERINFTVNVTDNIAVDTVTLNITKPSGTVVQAMLSKVGSIYNVTFTDTNETGVYIIRVITNDTSKHQNYNTTERVNFTVDSVGPTLITLRPIAQSNASGNSVINISATVTDEFLSVDIVLANITFPDNITKEQVRLSKIGNIYNFSFSNTSQNGVYNITFIANDTAGNLNTTEKTNFTIDSLNPIVTNVRPVANNFTHVNSIINISATVSDNIGVEIVFANITYPNNITKEQVRLSKVGNAYNFSFSNTSIEGDYNVTFIVNDTIGNINDSEKTNFTVDSTGPTIRTLRPISGTAQNNESFINISATGTDEWLDVDVVLANITFPDNTTKQQLILIRVGNTYSVNFTNTTQTGTYNITFIGNDTAGNLNTTEKTNFTIDGIKPTVENVRPIANNVTGRNSIVNISATVTDNLFVDVVFVNVTYPDNTTKEQLLLERIGYFFNFSFANTSTEGYYNVTFIANDTIGNINDTEKTNFTIDSTGPNIVEVKPLIGTNQTRNSTVNISATVTDQWLNVDTVLANITYPDNTTKEQVRLERVSNVYNVSFWNTNQSGVYNITFIANDTAGNLNTTEKTEIVILEAAIPPIPEIRTTNGESPRRSTSEATPTATQTNIQTTSSQEQEGITNVEEIETFASKPEETKTIISSLGQEDSILADPSDQITGAVEGIPTDTEKIKRVKEEVQETTSAVIKYILLINVVVGAILGTVIAAREMHRRRIDKLFHQKSREEIVQDKLSALEKYVHKAYEEGLSFDEIKEAILEAGWYEYEVDEVVKNVMFKKESSLQ